MASAVTLVIDRTELTLADLNLNDPGTYSIRSFNAGRVRRRSTIARSPYIEGATVVSTVRDIVEMDIAIDVEATTQAALQTRLDTLLDAFQQSSYTLTYGLDATTYEWTCYPAEYEVGIASPDAIFGFVLPVGLIVMRQPAATAGPY